MEVILAIAIFAMFSTSVFYLAMDNLQSSEKIEEGNEALFYAQEGLEAIRQMRDRNYLLLENGDHGLQLSSDVWSFIPAPEDIDGFYSRTVSIEDVYRDLDGNIAESGTLDPDTKKAISSVSWMYKGIVSRSVELETYLSNWTGDAWMQTDCDEFNNGTFDNTDVEFTASPPENNCAIILALEEYASEFVVSSDLGEHGRKVIVDGNYAYVAVNKSTTGVEIVDVTDRAHPSVVKTLDVGGKGLALAKSGNYLFAGVEKESKGLAVIDVSNPSSASVVTTKDVGGEAISMAISGNYLYAGVKKSSGYKALKVIDISNPLSVSVYSTFPTAGKVYDIKIVDGYAYCGIDYDWLGFQIINISNPASLTSVSTLSVGEEVNAVAIQGPYAFLGTENDNDSFYVVNISDPVHPSIATHLDVDEEIQDLEIQGDYVYTALDDNDDGLAVINVSIPTNPYLAYKADVYGKATSVFTDENYVYITTDVNNRGLIILGTTVLETNASGTYVSDVFDTGSSDTKYNFITWVSDPVPGSAVKFQIRTADSEAGIENAIFVGSDGTSGTYYETPKTIIITDPSASGTRFVQFKAYLESDGLTSPLLESVIINYTP